MSAYEDAAIAAMAWVQSLPQQELGIMTLRKAFELGYLRATTQGSKNSALRGSDSSIGAIDRA
jgi:hypothetical protein